MEAVISFIRGFLDPVRGLGFILGRPPLVRRAVAPIAVTALLYAALLVLLLLFSGDLMDRIWEKPEGGWLVPLYYVVYVFLLAASVGVSLVAFTFVAKIVGGPFLTKLSRAVLEELQGAPPKAPGGCYADLVYPVLLEIQNLVFFLLVQGALLAAQLFVPGSSLVIAPLQFLVAAFFLALGFLDYPLETGEKLPGFRGRIRYGRAHLPRTLGFGTALVLMLPIPFVGFAVLPAAVAGASLFYFDEKKRA